MPTLLFLPSLTPADESVRLLRPAYSALFTLAEVCFPTSEEEPKKIRLFDRIMRHGILQGFLHSRDDVKIVEVLLEELTALVQFMGIYATKHLKVRVIFVDPRGKLNLLTFYLLGHHSHCVEYLMRSFWYFSAASAARSSAGHKKHGSYLMAANHSRYLPFRACQGIISLLGHC